MTYRFRPWQELLWGILVAGATVALIEVAGLNPDTVPDWHAWAVALGAGVARAMAGAALDYLRRSVAPHQQGTGLADEILALPQTERELLLLEVDDRARRGEGER